MAATSRCPSAAPWRRCVAVREARSAGWSVAASPGLVRWGTRVVAARGRARVRGRRAVAAVAGVRLRRAPGPRRRARGALRPARRPAPGPRGAALRWSAARAARPHGRRRRLGLARSWPGRRPGVGPDRARSSRQGLDTLERVARSHGVDAGSGALDQRRARGRRPRGPRRASSSALSGAFSSLVSLGIGAAIGAFLVYYVIVDWDGPDPLGGRATSASTRRRAPSRR